MQATEDAGETFWICGDRKPSHRIVRVSISKWTELMGPKMRKWQTSPRYGLLQDVQLESCIHILLQITPTLLSQTEQGYQDDYQN